MIKVVIDTNVLVSAALTPNGNPAKILDLICSSTTLQVCYSTDILAEYRDVLSRPHLKITAEKQLRVIGAIINTGMLVMPTVSTDVFPDEDDRIFYDAALENNAKLITGNIRHYPSEDFIMTPIQFLDMLNSDEPVL